jgi:hypothetical protein
VKQRPFSTSAKIRWFRKDRRSRTLSVAETLSTSAWIRWFLKDRRSRTLSVAETLFNICQDQVVP